MSASERDREAALAALDVLRRCGAGVNSKRVEKLADIIATARAEARREAFSEGAELLARLCCCCADDDNDTETRDCMACQCAAALRAKAGEEKP